MGVEQGFREIEETVTNVIADLKQIPLEELEDSYGTYPERYKPTSKLVRISGRESIDSII